MYKVKMFIIVFSLISLCSCEEVKEKEEKEKTLKKEEKIVKKEQKANNMTAFWEIFQKVIAANDTQALKAICAMDKGTGLPTFFEDHHENVITEDFRNEIAITFVGNLKRGKEPMSKTLSYIFKYPVNLHDEDGTAYKADLTFYFAVHRGEWKVIAIIIER